MRTLFFSLILLGLPAIGLAQGATTDNEDAPEAPQEYRRPLGYDPAPYRYKHSLEDMKRLYSEQMMKTADKEYDRIMNVNYGGKWKPTASSIDRHKAPEWFADAKFGMFIDWGLWSIAGWAPRNEKGAMYPDWYEHSMYYFGDVSTRYHAKNWGVDFERDDFIPFFKAERYQPEFLIDIAEEAGMKYVVPFNKHHSGFCLWPSSYTLRHTGTTIGKDLVKPLVDGCREKGLKFGFYFSIEEWEYPVIGPNGEIINRRGFGNPEKHPIYEPYTPKLENLASMKIPVNDFSRQYLIPQAVEFIDKYDPDLIWYDGDWETEVEIPGAYDITAYYYNHAEGRKEVAVNDRMGLKNGQRMRSVRGDFSTSEYGNLHEGYRSRKVWEECRGISQSYGFNWQDTDENILTSKKFIDMFIDIVSKGGNLLLMVNLDAQGALPEMQEKRLKDIGKWLKVNGEGIYATREYSNNAEGSVRYTRSKDNSTVYAISLEWPGSQLRLQSVKPADKSEIYMLGYDKPLKWAYKDGVTTINIPSALQKASARPCEHAYTFRIKQNQIR